MNDTKKWLHRISFVLVIIAAIDLLIYGIYPANSAGEGFDLIQYVFGFNQDLFIFYCLLTGAAAIYLSITHRSGCKVCEKPNEEGEVKK